MRVGRIGGDASAIDPDLGKLDRPLEVARGVFISLRPVERCEGDDVVQLDQTPVGYDRGIDSTCFQRIVLTMLETTIEHDNVPKVKLPIPFFGRLRPKRG